MSISMTTREDKLSIGSHLKTKILGIEMYMPVDRKTRVTGFYRTWMLGLTPPGRENGV